MKLRITWKIAVLREINMRNNFRPFEFWGPDHVHKVNTQFCVWNWRSSSWSVSLICSHVNAQTYAKVQKTSPFIKNQVIIFSHFRKAGICLFAANHLVEPLSAVFMFFLWVPPPRSSNYVNVFSFGRLFPIWMCAPDTINHGRFSWTTTLTKVVFVLTDLTLTSVAWIEPV